MSEHRRTAAYSNDLRWRIVWQKIVDGFADKDISQNLHVSRSTVVRILDRFERTGSVNPNRATPKAHCLHDHDEFVLIQLVCENPSTYLHELKQMLFESTGVNASESTIC